jgi:enamine deaminase RidA (YjgF/YER057c/UK114 family)
MPDIGAMNEGNKKYFQVESAARSDFALKALTLSALVEIETIAVKISI